MCDYIEIKSMINYFEILKTWKMLFVNIIQDTDNVSSRLDLGRHLQGDAELVTTGVEVSSVDESGEGEGHSVPQLLLVAQTDLGGVVDLGPDHGPVLQDVLGSNTELGVAVGGAPAQSDSGLQLGAQLLEDGPPEVRAVGEAGVEDHVGGGVAQTEVALGDGRLAQVEASLVSGKPTLITSLVET